MAFVRGAGGGRLLFADRGTLTKHAARARKPSARPHFRPRHPRPSISSTKRQQTRIFRKNSALTSQTQVQTPVVGSYGIQIPLSLSLPSPAVRDSKLFPKAPCWKLRRKEGETL